MSTGKRPGLNMFNDDVVARWVGERKMQLICPVIFTDKQGKKWTAKAGDCVDGASIPKFFWRFIGSPFVGRYRRPSVIHDVYCESKTEPCEKVHALF